MPSSAAMPFASSSANRAWLGQAPWAVVASGSARSLRLRGNAQVLACVPIAALLPFEGLLPVSLIPLIYAALLAAAMAMALARSFWSSDVAAPMAHWAQRWEWQFYLTFLLVSALSIYWAADSLLAFKKLSHLSYMLLLTAMVALCKPASLRLLWQVFVISCVAACVVALYRISSGSQLLLNNRFVLGHADENFFAVQMVVALALLWSLRWPLLPRAIATMLLASSVMLSGSRTGAALLILSALVAAALNWRRGYFKLHTVLLAVAFVTSTVAVISLALGDIAAAAGARYELAFAVQEAGIEQVTNGRSDVWVAGISLVAEHIFRGVGVGNFPLAVTDYSTVTYLLNAQMERGVAAHSAYLAVLGETGLLGFVSYIGWQLGVGLLAWRLRRSAAGMAMFAALLAMSIAGLVLNVESFKLLALIQGGVLVYARAALEVEANSAAAAAQQRGRQSDSLAATAYG